MTDPLTAATEALVWATWILATVGAVQLFVNVLLWRANSVQARAAERQLLAANRPRVRIDWALTAGDDPDGADRTLVGTMREVLRKPVMLHWAKPTVNVHGIGRTTRDVPACELDGEHVALLVDKLVPTDAVIDVDVLVCVSTVDVPDTKETWRHTSTLTIFLDLASDAQNPKFYVSVLWQTKTTIQDADAPSDHGNTIASALMRAWTRGL